MWLIIEFILLINDLKIEITGRVQHSGSKFSGIEFVKFGKNKQEFFDYIDHRVVKKFHIPTDYAFKGFFQKKLDMKLTLVLMIIEAIVLIFAFSIFRTSSTFKINL